MATRDKVQTLGEMELVELIESADREVQGLVELADSYSTKEAGRWVRAYGGSIRARLAVAEMKARASLPKFPVLGAIEWNLEYEGEPMMSPLFSSYDDCVRYISHSPEEQRGRYRIISRIVVTESSPWAHWD